MNLTGVSTDGVNPMVIQIGDSGGVETSGYVGSVFSDVGHNNSAQGFQVSHSGVAAALWNGTVIMTLVDSANFSWVSMTSTGSTGDVDASAGGGSKSLSAELTQVRLTSEGTPDDFDAGKVNITYE